SSNSKSDQQARYQQALTQQPVVKAEYDTALQRQNELQASFFANNQAAHGILNRLEALSQLSSGNFTVAAARLLLFLLFLVIELLPVTVKLMQRPGLYEEALGHAREAELKDVKKFYSFRSRLVGPDGTALMRPTLQMEPDHHIQAIWTPARALPGPAAPDGDVRTDDPPLPPAPGRTRPEQRWDGANRWRNHWQSQPIDDTGPPTGASRTDEYMPGPGEPGIRPRGPAAAAPRAPQASDDWPDDDRDTQPASWHDDRAGGARGGQTPAPMVSPGSGGTPLSWDEDD